MTAEQAETYLRLRAEAELRRALRLPRYVPPGAAGMPAPLRAAADLARPGAALIASAARPVRPLATRATDALQPLADDASRALRPLAEDAARALRPLAEDAAHALQPLGERAAVRLRPLAEQTAHRLESIGWRAFGAAQTLGGAATSAIMSVQRQAARAISSRPGARPGYRPGAATGHRELSAEEGVHRLRMVASALVQAGAIDSGTADSAITDLQIALLARSRTDPRSLARQDMMARHLRPAAGAPAGLYRAAGVGVTIPAAPDSDLGDTRLLTLVIAPDRASLTAVGHRLEPPGQAPRHNRWPGMHHSGSWPGAADDRGNIYKLNLAHWGDDSDGDWSGTLDISPVPAAGIRWLDLNVSSGSAPIRVDLTSADVGSDAAVGPIPAGGPVDRLFEAAAENLLDHAARHGKGDRWHHHLSYIADVATALEASGALPPACAGLDRLVALARHLGAEVPAALSATAHPAGLPDSWTSVLANGHRRDGPQGIAAAAAVLPELDGTRVVLAGLRSAAADAELRVLGWGQHLDTHFAASAEEPWSWWARDDAGRWHIARTNGGSFGNGHSDMQLQLFPPLHPEATSLDVMVTGRSGRVTVTIPLNWLAPE